MRLLLTGLALGLAAQTALAQNKAGNDNIVVVRSGDAAMAQAVRAARESLPAFFEKLERPSSSGRFSVKFNLTPKGNPEFIWAGDLRREGGALTGALAGRPLAKGYESGQRVTIAEAEIIDWAYFSGTVAQGHFTTKVILDRMERDQAAAIRQALGWAE